MKKFLVTMFMLSLAMPLFAQRGNIETDIFGDLRYETRDRSYNAALKKDIFDNLVFTDSRRNNIVFEKKYLDLEYPKVVGNPGARSDFFNNLVRRHRHDERYEAKYKVDIFGTVIIEDNRGNKTEIGTDIFGNAKYEERRNGHSMSVSRDLNGVLQYRSGGDSASLGKDIFGKWTYKDSSGNKFEFSDKAWYRLIRRFGGDEQVLIFLMDEYLRD